MNEINIEWQQRTELLLGKDKMKRLRHAHVLVVGLGGVEPASICLFLYTISNYHPGFCSKEGFNNISVVGT